MKLSCLTFFTLIVMSCDCKAQCPENSPSKNKFIFPDNSGYFASFDENFVNDTILSGYCIKDIRGVIISTVLFKVGLSINNRQTLKPYTEIIFTTSFQRCQISGFVCPDTLSAIFRSLLFTMARNPKPKEKYISNTELDYQKVTAFVHRNTVKYTDKIRMVWSPVENYYNLLKYYGKFKKCVPVD